MVAEKINKNHAEPDEEFETEPESSPISEAKSPSPIKLWLQQRQHDLGKTMELVGKNDQCMYSIYYYTCIIPDMNGHPDIDS